MDTKALRQKILDLAIRGKLVPQYPNDEPASVLLERIRAEKERLIAEGKIKRPKKAKSSSSESHYQKFTPPFPIPDSWEWVRLSDCCHITGRIGFRGYTKDDLVEESEGAITLSPSNIINGNMNYDKCTYISWAKYDESPEIMVENDDILIVKTGSSFGKCALVKDLPKEATINPQFVVLKYIKILAPFLTIILQSSYSRKSYDNFVLGTAIPTFTQEKLSQLPIPLPPFSEQVRIMDAIVRFDEALDKLKSNNSFLNNLVSSAKSKILKLAMQGKLVPQDPTDEPAADMLRRINPKARIITDNPHYPQLPDNWVLTTVDSICNYGKCTTVSVEAIRSDEWVLELEDIERDTGNVLQYYAKNQRVINGSRHSFKAREVLYSKLRTYLNKVLLAPKKGYCTTEIIPINAYDCINPEFLCLWLRSPYFLDYTISCGYGVKMPRLSTTHARNGIVPLPPIKEQERIVSAVNSFFSSLQDISMSIN